MKARLLGSRTGHLLGFLMADLMKIRCSAHIYSRAILIPVGLDEGASVGLVVNSESP